MAMVLLSFDMEPVDDKSYNIPRQSLAGLEKVSDFLVWPL